MQTTMTLFSNKYKILFIFFFFFRIVHPSNHSKFSHYIFLAAKKACILSILFVFVALFPYIFFYGRLLCIREVTCTTCDDVIAIFFR